MKIRFFLFIAFTLCLLSCKNTQTTTIKYNNPLPIAFGDPFILAASDGKYYMYGTSGENGFRVYSSDDLSTWKNEGMVYEGATPDSWTVDCFWAPEVYERNGKYYLWYSANWKNNPTNELEKFRIGVAVADKPTGPFKEMNGGPVFDPGYPVIDANLFFDDENNKVYLYYSRCCYKHPVESEVANWAKEKGWYDEVEESWVYGVELKSDFSGIIGEPVLLLRPPVTMSDSQTEWESRSVTSKEINRRWTEGSYLFKRGDTYYMMYSANYFMGADYAVGYATSKSPLGPFQKSPDNPVLQKNVAKGGNVTGTGHNMVLTLPDGQMLCVYHGRTKSTGDERMVFIDKMEVQSDGKLVVHGPTTGETNTAAASQSGETTFTNPVIYSDVPDVDVIRVGSDYFMVSTTAHMSPGAPIMHSKDMVNWKIISYLYDELHESPHNNLEGGNIYSRGQWAASLRYHGDTFYVFFGTGNKSYIYKTKDPFGKWEQQLVIDEYLHDASMLFDDDGKIYLVYGAGHVRIIEFEPDLLGIKKDGLNVEVISGDPPGLLEGVHFYKYGDTYYMTYIWWPQGGIRTQLCYRSKQVGGPYESKIILSDDLGFANHGVAQGCFIDTEDGEWYAMLFQDHEAVGRVPVLMPCRWIDGWPMLGDENGKVPHTMKVPVQGHTEKTAIVVSDDFDKAPKLGLTWQWNHNPDNSLWSLTERPGYLRLKTGKVVKDIFEARNTLTQRTEGPKCSGVIALDLSKMKDGDYTGLAAFCSDPGTISVTQEKGKKYIIMTDRGVEKARTPLNQNKVYLKMDCDFTTDNATFSYSLDDKEWKRLGDTFHMIFSMKHFTGNKFAIFNYSTKSAGGYVDVDFFRYSKP